MPSSSDLAGLMKFLTRDVWSDCFDEVFEIHFGPVLNAAGMEFDDLVEIIGEDWAMALWGCAFEDFATQDFDVEGGNIIDEYLKRRGWKESAQAKAYMKALRSSTMSLYEVSEIVPGSSLMARDLIRGGGPIAVSDRSATKTLKQWDKIAARIVPVTGANVFTGVLLPFTPKATEALFEELRVVFGKKNAKKLPLIKTDDLREAAAAFTLSWLLDTIERTMNLPELRNADGEDLVLHKVRFPLEQRATQEDVTARINTIPAMSQKDATFWNWLEERSKNNARESAGLSADAISENGLRIVGNVELKARFLQLETNSAERADRGMALLEQALDDLLRPPLVEIRTMEQLMAETPAEHQTDDMSEIPSEVTEQVIHEFMDRQYRETLDQSVGMLGFKTPRQTAKSAAGRQKVAEWLKYLENQTSKRPDSSDPMATYSFEWMWHELGVADLRR